jgi:hypothetical protein
MRLSVSGAAPGFPSRSITGTAVYTALAPNRSKDFWRDYRGRQADFRGAAS